MEGEPVRETAGKADKVPLYMKLYFHAAYTEVARVVGYAGFPRDQLEEKMKDLVERFGRKKIQEACGDLITMRFKGKEKRSGPQEDAEVHLKDDVRKLCWQLLGPPPEKKAEFDRDATGSAASVQEATQKVPRPKQAEGRRKKPRTKEKESKPEAESTSAEMLSETPLMRQYREAKEKHPGMLLLFRIGDFFELFGEDAEAAHTLLGLTLTTRDQTHTMVGFPHHQLEAYLHKLLKEGRHVAICEPVEESLAKGPIKREVTRVVTPDRSRASDDEHEPRTE